MGRRAWARGRVRLAYGWASLALFQAGLGAACLSPPPGLTATVGTTVGTTSTSEGGMPTSMGAGASTSGSTEAGSAADTEDCAVMVCGDLAKGGPCDIWAQDCPEGEKCVPWSENDGYSWSTSRCVPIDPAPKQPGEGCTVAGGGVSGVDNCADLSMCFWVDPVTGEGTCVDLCEGTGWEDATCDGGFSCEIASDSFLILCLKPCDPLLQDCPNGDLCIPFGEDSTCVLDASGEAGHYGDPCEYANACKPGLHCLNPEYVEGCMAAGCCTPYCDTTAPLKCPGATQECIPWYEEGMAPPGFERLGICGVPP